MNIILSNSEPYQFEIFDRITKFNKEKNPQLRGTNALNFGDFFGFYAMENDELIGGIVGNEKMQWLDIDALFVDEKHRNQAIGTKLIEKIIEYCKENNLIGIHLTTMEFQAKGFYEKMNFELIAEIKDWPKGITRYEFIKYV